MGMPRSISLQRRSIIFWLAAFIASLLIYLYVFILLPQSQEIGLAYWTVSIFFLFLYITGFVLATWIRRSWLKSTLLQVTTKGRQFSPTESTGPASTAFILVVMMPVLAYMCIQGIAFIVSSFASFSNTTLILLNFLRILPPLTAYAFNRILPLTTNKALAFISALPVVTVLVILWGSRLLLLNLSQQNPGLFYIFLWPTVEILIGISVAFFGRLGAQQALRQAKTSPK